MDLLIPSFGLYYLDASCFPYSIFYTEEICMEAHT